MHTSYLSSAGYIVNKTRSSLEPNTVNTLVCLRSWLKDDVKGDILVLFRFSTSTFNKCYLWHHKFEFLALIEINY